MKRFSPAAERTKKPILESLRRVLPSTGVVLEVASGTGQHVAYFAAELPNLLWQPSEVGEVARESIGDWTAGLPNVRPPVTLDVASAHWPCDAANAVIAIMLLHITPPSVTQGLLRGAGRVLSPGEPLCMFGPFHPRDIGTASARTAAAHLASWTVRQEIPNLTDIGRVAAEHEFDVHDTIDMPESGHYLLVLRRR